MALMLGIAQSMTALTPFNLPERKKLLFLAMSGVRVFDQELLSLGLTLPGFVERSRVIASLPSLGLLTLAAHTPADWSVAYREYDELPEDAAEQIVADGFMVVAISSLTARIDETYVLASALRSLGVVVILGGLHVSALPDEAACHADIVVKGEGERLWPQVITDLERGTWLSHYDAATASVPSSFHEEQPVPRYDLLDLERYNRLTLQTTRGCPLHCSFCAASRTISPYRKKSHEQIRRELEAILSLWPRPFIELADDNTFVDKKWSRDLVRLLSEYPVKWFTESDISLADDDELLHLLGDSGCTQVLIGLESAASESMRGVDAQDWKSRRHRDYAEQVRRIQDHGISVNGCFILGFDQDGPDIFQRTLDYIDSLELSEAQITLLTPFPGTSLRQQLAAEGRLLADASWSQHTLFDLTFQPAQMSVESMKQGFRWLMKEVYSDQRVASRRKTFKNCIRHSRHELHRIPFTPVAAPADFSVQL
ncbi:MAG: radical SAM protein [Prosthecobacter sp.]